MNGINRYTKCKIHTITIKLPERGNKNGNLIDVKAENPTPHMYSINYIEHKTKQKIEEIFTKQMILTEIIDCRFNVIV